MAGGANLNRSSRVPSGRVERLARLGVMASGLAAGAVAERARRFMAGEDKLPRGRLLLTERNARQLAKNLSRMRGAAMKLGQLISLENGVSLPVEFADAMTALRNHSDSMPLPQLRGVLGRELGRGWQSRFQEFDERPIASASIGQVHRAVTTDGREIALKVQYPGVATSISSDVDNLAALLRMTRILPESLEIRPVLAEVKRQLRRETDYLAEADSLERYASLIGDDPMFIVPRVHRDLTTRRVLAMDYVEGKPLQDLWEAKHPRKVRDAIGSAMQRLVFLELFEFGYMQSDPNFANYLFSPNDGRLILLDLGAAVEIEPELIDGYSRLSAAVVSKDRAAVREIATEFGVIHPEEQDERIDSLIDLVLMCSEPLRGRGRYDYGESDLPARARKLALGLAFAPGRVQPPPPQALFIHRKLGGTYLVCSRLAARIDTRSLYLDHTAGRG